MSEDTPIKNTIQELKNILNEQSFIGEPIETEDKILIPIMRMGFSFAEGSDYSNNLRKNGSGAVAGIEPTSMVVVSKNTEGMEGIRVLNISKATEKNKSISDLGLIISDIVKDLTGLAQSYPIDVDAQETNTQYQEQEVDSEEQSDNKQ